MLAYPFSSRQQEQIQESHITRDNYDNGICGVIGRKVQTDFVKNMNIAQKYSGSTMKHL
jgi:hypothetical protein